MNSETFKVKLSSTLFKSILSLWWSNKILHQVPLRRCIYHTIHLFPGWWNLPWHQPSLQNTINRWIVHILYLCCCRHEGAVYCWHLMWASAHMRVTITWANYLFVILAFLSIWIYTEFVLETGHPWHCIQKPFQTIRKAQHWKDWSKQFLMRDVYSP